MSTPLRDSRIGILTKLWRVFFPPSRWNKCHEPMPWERKANWRIRQGMHAAELEMRAAERGQRIDEFASTRVRPAIKPKLPNDNVVPIKRKRRAA